jgi:hypothetical protein
LNAPPYILTVRQQNYQKVINHISTIRLFRESIDKLIAREFSFRACGVIN